MNSLKEAAISYAKSGWAVLPLFTAVGGVCDCGRAGCESPAKHPRTLHGLADATCDLGQVESWWEIFPTANIGVVAGKSGLLVLDVDPRNGGTESALQLGKEFGALPKTAVSRTGGGGVHYLFKRPVQGCGNRSAIRPGIDLKGDGGYFVAAPSNHISGAQYEWLADPANTAIADPPGWLLALLGNEKKKQYMLAGDDDPILEGNRDNTLTSLAGTMRRRGMSKKAILAALRATNEQCRPPLEDKDLLRITESIGSRPPEEAERAAKMAAVAEDGWRVTLGGECIDAVDLAPYIDMPIPYLVKPLFVRSSLTQIQGLPKGGKSAFLLYLSICAATGTWPYPELLGKDAPQLKVLYIAWEDPKIMMAKRLSWFGTGLGFDRTFMPTNLRFLLGPRIFVESDPHCEALRQAILEWNADIVVIDTLSHIHGANENEATEMKIPMDNIDRISKSMDISIVYAHHNAKGSGEKAAQEKGRGSGTIAAAWHVLIDWMPRSDDASNVNPVLVQSKYLHRWKRWNVEYNPRYAENADIENDDPVSVGWVVSNAEEKKGEEKTSSNERKRKRIVEVLTSLSPSQPEGWVNVALLTDACNLGLDHKSIKRHCQSLCEEGILLSKIGAHNAFFFKLSGV